MRFFIILMMTICTMTRSLDWTGVVLFQEQQQEEPWWPSQRVLDHYSAELGGDNVVVADLIATGSDVLAVVDYVLVDN